MIYSLEGILEYSDTSMAVVNCGGVGYAVRTTFNTASKLAKVGEKVKVYTYMSVREDAVELFGFYDTNELNCFKQLISVSGVGPKAALSILSQMTPEAFALAVVSSDSKAITKAQGIGTKIAQRIVLELKDKMAKSEISAGENVIQVTSNAHTTTTNASEAITALVVLGYTNSEATKAVSSLDPNLAVEELIKKALSKLVSGAF
ncbi:MAG: Holliday junction branch migration protein RuvA [Oscillospiraceae bacterium]|nr:Holliday junction branch migration protein RuvA [Oscillospiraceae bacterium]